MMFEKSSRALTSSASAGTLLDRKTGGSVRILTPSNSVDALHKPTLGGHICVGVEDRCNSLHSTDSPGTFHPPSPSARIQQERTFVGIGEVFGEEEEAGSGDELLPNLDRSLSIASLLSVDSDRSQPPMPPPRSSPLDTGIVLQPDLRQPRKVAPIAVISIDPVPTAAIPPTAPASNNLSIPASATAQGQQVRFQSAACHPQKTMIAECQTHQPRAPAATGPQWVIEEVIDFGPPVDDVAHELEDALCPTECRNLVVGRPSPNENFLFGGCYKSVCQSEKYTIVHHGSQARK